MTDTAAPRVLTDDDYDELRWEAGKPYLAELLEHVPDDDDPLNVRMSALTFAANRADELARRWPTEAPGRGPRELLAALEEAGKKKPLAKPIVGATGVPQAIRAAAKLCSTLALDPARVDDLAPVLDGIADAVMGGPGRPIAEYHAAVDAARETLAQAAEERLSRIPSEWRAAVSAFTRAEHDERERIAAQVGAEVLR